MNDLMFISLDTAYSNLKPMNTGAHTPPPSYILEFSSSNDLPKSCIILCLQHARTLLIHISKLFHIHGQAVIKMTPYLLVPIFICPFYCCYVFQRSSLKENWFCLWILRVSVQAWQNPLMCSWCCPESIEKLHEGTRLMILAFKLFTPDDPLYLVCFTTF